MRATFVFYAEKGKLTVREREVLVCGSVNTYQVCFEFSGEWEGLVRTALFRAGNQTIPVRLDKTGQCTIPWEVLAARGYMLYAGIYGTRGSEVVRPTTWAPCGYIRDGTEMEPGNKPATPGIYEQILEEAAGKGDGLSYDGEELTLLSGDRALSAVSLAGGDHGTLRNREAPDQHPIRAITGLQEALDTIPQPMSAGELRELLRPGE